MKPEFVKELLVKLGCSLRSQAPTEWTGEYQLPGDLLEFYRVVGPDCAMIEVWGGPIFIPSLGELESQQVGYRSHPESGERFGDWLDEWIVVADANADPLIFCKGEILFAEHSTGHWSPYPIFADVYQMAGAFAFVGLVAQEAGGELTDEECNVNSRHRDRAITGLSKLVGLHTAELTIKSLGWD